MTNYTIIYGTLDQKSRLQNNTIKFVLGGLYVVAKDKIAGSVNTLPIGAKLIVEGNLSVKNKTMFIWAKSIEIYSQLEEINIENIERKDFEL